MQQTKQKEDIWQKKSGILKKRKYLDQKKKESDGPMRTLCVCLRPAVTRSMSLLNQNRLKG